MKVKFLALAIVLGLSASLHAATINLVGTLADHDGDGSNANEMADLNRSISLWESLILTDRTFTLSVSSFALRGSSGVGGVSGLDGNNIPTSGVITMSTNTTWLVGTSQNQFTQHFDSNEHHQHFVDGPTGGRDFLSVLNQEIGHALGWIPQSATKLTFTVNNTSNDSDLRIKITLDRSHHLAKILP